MAVADEEDGWLPLPEALERFADPALRQAWQDASPPSPRRASNAEPWLGRRTGRFQARTQDRPAATPDQRAVAQEALLRDFKRRLRSGELIASGLALPLTPTSRRTDIARGLWDLLNLRPRAGEAAGKGLRIIKVHIRRAHPQQKAEHLDGAIEQTPRRPGPKSIMPQIEAEMRARAERGELKVGITAECRALEKWAKAEYPNHPRAPKAKSIQNELGTLYYDLRVNAGS